MSFLKNTVELKNEVLSICGELTDGSSLFENLAIESLDNLYQGLLGGGNEFGIEVAEPWVWAQSKRPIVISLVPAFSGAATITQDSNLGTFSLAPTYSLQGRYFRVESRADIYRIANHTAGDTAFTLDQPYLDDGGNLNYMAFKLDYELVDDTIIIDSSNNKLDFREASLTDLTATITVGTYTPTTLCAEIKTQLEASGSNTYTVTFDSLNRKFTISSSGLFFELSFSEGENILISISGILGYDIEDQTGALTYTSEYSLNGILRLTKPITMYREAPTYWSSPRDVGKIFMIDDNTFLREYPLNRLTQDVPDKFCPVEITPDGLWKARFNSSVLDKPVRAEVNFIPVTRSLMDNVASIPLVPGNYSKYLVYGASYYILMEKSDNKAQVYYDLAKAKLLALVNDNRKNASIAGNNFGKLIPRRGQVRIWGYNR